MNASAAVHVRAASRHGLDRVRATLAAVGAAVLGAAPHVLHHAGPLAGAALLAGVSGRVLFGALGLLLAIPLLGGGSTTATTNRVPSASPGVSPAEHEAHHR